MLSDHFATRRVARLVVVEAAVDVIAASDQWIEPWWIGSNARSRDADASRMKFRPVQLKAADRVDRRFAEDNLVRASSADPEVTGVLARAGCQSAPHSLTGAPQFGTNRMIGFPPPPSERPRCRAGRHRPFPPPSAVPGRLPRDNAAR